MNLIHIRLPTKSINELIQSVSSRVTASSISPADTKRFEEEVAPVILDLQRRTGTVAGPGINLQITETIELSAVTLVVEARSAPQRTWKNKLKPLFPEQRA